MSVPKSVSDLGMFPVIVTPWVLRLMTPLMMIEMPSVVITALTPRRVTSSALTTPTIRPTAMAIRIATGTAVPWTSACAA